MKHEKAGASVIPFDVEQLVMKVSSLEQQVKLLIELVSEHNILLKVNPWKVNKERL